MFAHLNAIIFAVYLALRWQDVRGTINIRKMFSLIYCFTCTTKCDKRSSFLLQMATQLWTHNSIFKTFNAQQSSKKCHASSAKLNVVSAFMKMENICVLTHSTQMEHILWKQNLAITMMINVWYKQPKQIEKTFFFISPKVMSYDTKSIDLVKFI